MAPTDDCDSEFEATCKRVGRELVAFGVLDDISKDENVAARLQSRGSGRPGRFNFSNRKGGSAASWHLVTTKRTQGCRYRSDRSLELPLEVGS